METVCASEILVCPHETTRRLTQNIILTSVGTSNFIWWKVLFLIIQIAEYQCVNKINILFSAILMKSKYCFPWQTYCKQNLRTSNKIVYCNYIFMFSSVAYFVSFPWSQVILLETMIPAPGLILIKRYYVFSLSLFLLNPTQLTDVTVICFKPWMQGSVFLRTTETEIETGLYTRHRTI
jgi:hypothetical protein